MAELDVCPIRGLGFRSAWCYPPSRLGGCRPERPGSYPSALTGGYAAARNSTRTAAPPTQGTSRTPDLRPTTPRASAAADHRRPALRTRYRRATRRASRRSSGRRGRRRSRARRRRRGRAPLRPSRRRTALSRDGRRDPLDRPSPSRPAPSCAARGAVSTSSRGARGSSSITPRVCRVDASSARIPRSAPRSARDLDFGTNRGTRPSIHAGSA